MERIHQRFPKLRIVLEHTTTAAAVAKVRAWGAGGRGWERPRLTVCAGAPDTPHGRIQVKELGDTVAATITVHVSALWAMPQIGEVAGG